jgi:hypothetical protein
VSKSTDGGLNWTAANAGMTPANVAALVIDPANSAILYAGTKGCSSNYLNPEGVFKSTDGATSWMTVNSGITDLQVISLAVDPSNSNVLYAGTRLHGVFKSVDAGANWSPVNSGLQPTSFAIDHFPLIIDPLNPGTVYAGTDNGVFKSTDSGINWTEANTGFPALTSVFALTIEPPPVTVTAGTVTIPVHVTMSSSGPTPPSGFQMGNPPTYYDIGTTASYTPPVTVCITYDPAPYPDPNLLRLLHYESDTWLDVTTSNDVAGHTIWGQVNSLSPFLIAQKMDKPPVLTAVSANPALLWPPNNRMVDVSVDYSATDDWDQPVCQISGVTSNEQLSSSDYALCGCSSY